MSAISLKSITGITSITTPAGVDDQLTLHNNNTTEAVKLDVAGNLHFHNHLNITGVSTASNFKTGTSNLHNTGLNVQDLDVDGHTNLDNVSIVGVVTVAGNVTAHDFLPDTNAFRNIGTSSKKFNQVHANTFFGNGDFVELDVDGHTNLDNVSIAGFTTISSTSNGEIFRIETSAGNPGGTQGLAYMGFDHFPASTKPAILIGCEEDGNASIKVICS